MKHDDRCEMRNDDRRPSCRCAERAYLATASPEEVTAWKKRRGYDTNYETGWDLPPRTVRLVTEQDPPPRRTVL